MEALLERPLTGNDTSWLRYLLGRWRGLSNHWAVAPITTHRMARDDSGERSECPAQMTLTRLIRHDGNKFELEASKGYPTATPEHRSNCDAGCSGVPATLSDTTRLHLWLPAETGETIWQLENFDGECTPRQ